MPTQSIKAPGDARTDAEATTTSTSSSALSPQETPERLQSYRQMVDIWPDPAAVFDVRQRIVVVNRALATWLGYPAARSLLGQPAAIVTLAEDRGILADYLDAVTGSPAGLPPLQQRFRHNDGRVLVGRMVGRPIVFDASAAALLVIRDSGLSAQTQERLEILEHALDHLSASALILDAEQRDGRGMRAVFANRPFLAGAGLRADQVVGQYRRLDEGADLDDAIRAQIDAAFAQSRELRVEFARRARDGRERWVELSLTPIYSEIGHHTHWLAVETDLTDRRDNDVRLLENERMLALGTLAAGIAHGINNPLAYVNPNISIAADEIGAVAAQGEGLTDDERARLQDAVALLGDARDGAVRIRGIVHNMKLLSTSNESVLVPTDVRRALDAAISMVSSYIRPKAELVCDYEDVPPVVASDGRLGQLFVNLLLNAVQAIPPPDAVSRHRIAVTVRNDEKGVVRIEIHDTGHGIPPEIRHRVYSPFFSTRPATTSTGLGLSICRRIVTALSGTISFESEVGKGTTFRVMLPATTGPAAVPGATAQVESSSPPARILVIDDEPPVAAALCRMLGPKHQIVTSLGGPQALEVLRWDRDFDAVFCDVNMPDASGIDVYRVIAKTDAKLAARFVFVTGGVFTADAQEFLDTVPNPCLEKPFDKTAVVAAVRFLSDVRRSE